LEFSADSLQPLPQAVVAVFHWLVRCLMKDLACSRVAARSRSTRKVL